MRNIVDHYAGRGYRSLDLGIGSDDYKRLFCKSDEPIFDCFIPLSLRGRLAAAAMSGINRAKHHGEAYIRRCCRWRKGCAARFTAEADPLKTSLDRASGRHRPAGRDRRHPDGLRRLAQHRHVAEKPTAFS